jgi:hypothetical protein
MSGVSGSSLVCWPPLYWTGSVSDSRSAGRGELADNAYDTLDHLELCRPGAVGLRMENVWGVALAVPSCPLAYADGSDPVSSAPDESVMDLSCPT